MMAGDDVCLMVQYNKPTVEGKIRALPPHKTIPNICQSLVTRQDRQKGVLLSAPYRELQPN